MYLCKPTSSPMNSLLSGTIFLLKRMHVIAELSRHAPRAFHSNPHASPEFQGEAVPSGQCRQGSAYAGLTVGDR